MSTALICLPLLTRIGSPVLVSSSKTSPKLFLILSALTVFMEEAPFRHSFSFIKVTICQPTIYVKCRCVYAHMDNIRGIPKCAYSALFKCPHPELRVPPCSFEAPLRTSAIINSRLSTWNERIAVSQFMQTGESLIPRPRGLFFAGWRKSGGLRRLLRICALCLASPYVPNLPPMATSDIRIRVIQHGQTTCRPYSIYSNS